MKKKIVTTVFFLATIVSFTYGKKAVKANLKPNTSKIAYSAKISTNSSIVNVKPACRMTCSISVYDEMTGNWYTLSASSGGLFTSCNTALENACQKVYEKAQNFFKEAEQ